MLDLVLQLPHISGPAVILEALDGLLRKPLHGFAELFLRAFEKRFGKHRNIHAPLAQGGHLDRYRGDLVIQILAEAAGLPFGLQIAIGGRDHPNVDVARLPAAHGADLALLQNSQELGLKDRGNFADPVEKNGAAIGALEKSGVFLDRA